MQIQDSGQGGQAKPVLTNQKADPRCFLALVIGDSGSGWPTHCLSGLERCRDNHSLQIQDSGQVGPDPRRDTSGDS